MGEGHRDTTQNQRTDTNDKTLNFNTQHTGKGNLTPASQAGQ